jgi:cysteinyl-tRNA synthetase
LRIIAENKALDNSFFLFVKEFLTSTAEEVLGILSFDTEQTSSSVEKELIELLISIRTDAKKQKNFSLADKIRDDLKTLGIVLEDSKDSTTFKKS